MAQPPEPRPPAGCTPLACANVRQRWVIEQLRGWRLCWDLAWAAGDMAEVEQLAGTLTAWLRLRAEQPVVVPDIAALAQQRRTGRAPRR